MVARPPVLRFYGSFNATITGTTIQNSPQCDLKFDNNPVGVAVHAPPPPEDSPKHRWNPPKEL
ncbi:hypothetical protein NC652_001203 [Populus alba x Populus x berolinensis]|nr:hypothetical protein NC652_001201 [Populus alba x Populus x berolinensis]KAJ6962469.1 hypothetical protein NC652_001203 [Populus alba x Populus x berolinensis]